MPTSSRNGGGISGYGFMRREFVAVERGGEANIRLIVAGFEKKVIR
jgi:hypothetical protein